MLPAKPVSIPVWKEKRREEEEFEFSTFSNSPVECRQLHYHLIINIIYNETFFINLKGLHRRLQPEEDKAHHERGQVVSYEKVFVDGMKPVI